MALNECNELVKTHSRHARKVPCALRECLLLLPLACRRLGRAPRRLGGGRCLGRALGLDLALQGGTLLLSSAQACGFGSLCTLLLFQPSPRRESHKLFIETAYDSERRAIIARNHMWEVHSQQFGHWNTSFPYVSAFACTEPIQAAQGDRVAFTGRNRGFECPEALAQDTWQPRFGRHDDPIAALRTGVVLQPGASRTIGFVLAIGDNDDHLSDQLARYADCAAFGKSLAAAQRDWRDRLAAHRAVTPDRSIDFITNDWLRYQAIAGRLWGRAGYYQQSGAYGFREQLEDSQVWVRSDRAQWRGQINRHAGNQFADGTGYEWWENFYEFHKLAIDELDHFDYDAYVKNGYRLADMPVIPLQLETKPE